MNRIGSQPPTSIQDVLQSMQRIKNAMNEAQKTTGINPIPNHPWETLQAPSSHVNFSSVLDGMIGNVQKNQQQAEVLRTQFELGDSKTSLAEVMMANQKANVSFQYLLQTRNKLLEAYRDIMNMQV